MKDRNRYVFLGTKVASEHKEILSALARRRGCSVSDLTREALIQHFNLPTDGGSTTTMIVDGYMERVS